MFLRVSVNKLCTVLLYCATFDFFSNSYFLPWWSWA